MSEVQIYQAVIVGIVVLSLLWHSAARSALAKSEEAVDWIRDQRNVANSDRDFWKRKAEQLQSDLVIELQSNDGWQTEAEWWRERFINHIEGDKAEAAT